MKGFLVSLSKLVLGVVTALLLLSLAGVATARYFMARLAVLPPMPMFENDAPPALPQTSEPQAAAPVTTPVAATTTAAPPQALEEGTYAAVVIQPIGLVLREGPGTTFAQMGGIDYNDAVVVLEESPDRQWVKVRVTDSGQEGWIKAGNTRQTQ